jgi:hypothetical protein
MSKPQQPRRRCLHIGEKKGIGAKNGIETSPAPDKRTKVGQGKGLATLWRRTRIAKKAHAGQGPETKWEMSD